MGAARYCALITQNNEGRASARTMDPTVPDSDMVVHFATTPSSRKVSELARDNRVTLYYFDAKLLRYVTLYGRAKIVRDPAQKRRAWKADWNPFYPKKEAGTVVFRVTPERLEIVSPPDNVVGDSVTWAPVTIPLRPRPAPR
ncbi:MAG: pyridoxamine 5'-phosphate oxidase family protein [Gemmatimonadaceae bacterium]